MNYLHGLLSALLAEGRAAVMRAKANGIVPDLFPGSEGAVLSFLYDYTERYGHVPAREVVRARSGLSFEAPSAPADFFIRELVSGRLLSLYGDGVEKVSRALESRDPDKVRAAWEETLREVRRASYGISPVVSLPSLAQSILDYHDRIQAGERGVLTPWDTLNDWTYGFWPEDFVLFVARLSVGKSWTLIQLADHAWRLGKRVLIATTEMSQLRMGLRWLAIHLKIPPSDLRRGELGDRREEVGERALALAEQSGLYVVGGNFKMSFETLEAAVEEVEPDFVLVDGVYLLRIAGSTQRDMGRFERAAELFEQVKDFNLRVKVPIAVSTQFNRKAPRNSPDSAEVENIALSDVGGWCADLILALIQTEDMKQALEMRIKSLKTREGSGGNFKIRWDVDNCDFSEIPEDTFNTESFESIGSPVEGGGEEGGVPF